MKLHGLCNHSYDLQNIEMTLLQVKYESHFTKLRKSSLVFLVFVDRSFKSQGTSRWTIVPSRGWWGVGPVILSIRVRPLLSGMNSTLKFDKRQQISPYYTNIKDGFSLKRNRRASLVGRKTRDVGKSNTSCDGQTATVKREQSWLFES